MKIKLAFKILDLIFPPKCASCGCIIDNDGPMCKACFEKYSSEIRKTCAGCGKTAGNCNCKKLSHAPLHICSTFYTHYENDSSRVTERLILALKRKKNLRLAEFFGREAAASVMKFLKFNGLSANDCLLTFPPRSEKGLQKNGFDHAELVAKRISYYTGIPLAHTLVRHGGDEQKKLGPEERLENAKGSLVLNNKADVKGKTVFLFDDVITTGATLLTATDLLRSIGADEIVLVTIAKTEAKRQ